MTESEGPLWQVPHVTIVGRSAAHVTNKQAEVGLVWNQAAPRPPPGLPRHPSHRQYPFFIDQLGVLQHVVVYLWERVYTYFETNWRVQHDSGIT